MTHLDDMTHLYVVGKIAAGKSTLIENAFQDGVDGNGLVAELSYNHPLVS